MPRISIVLPILSVLAFASTAAPAQSQKRTQVAAAVAPDGEVARIEAPAQIWRQPTNIAALDLRDGSGGQSDAPEGTTMKFVAEDLHGTNPKYIVTDANGAKFTIKLGPEAQPETVASRMIWAAGYFTREDYYLPEIRVTGLPDHLKRGRKLIGPDGRMSNVRMERLPPGDKHVGDWKWDKNRFIGTRPFNGLRVMMALIDNWDLKDENNSIYRQGGSRSGGDTGDLYLVSDLGASFGMTHQFWVQSDAEGNPSSYMRAKFIRKEAADYVDFADPGLPQPLFILLMEPGEIAERFHMRWIRHRVPRADAVWIGGLLAQLSPQQLRDAFAAAGYSDSAVDMFVETLQLRIAALNHLA